MFRRFLPFQEDFNSLGLEFLKCFAGKNASHASKDLAWSFAMRKAALLAKMMEKGSKPPSYTYVRTYAIKKLPQILLLEVVRDKATKEEKRNYVSHQTINVETRKKQDVLFLEGRVSVSCFFFF